MIVSSKTHFTKPYQTGYKYCLMVNEDNKVYMVWNYIAREYMDIRDKNFNLVNGKYTVNEVKKLLKDNEIQFAFWIEYRIKQ